MSNLLMIFVKNTISGHVKTRLTEGIGEERALQVYEILCKKTKKVAKSLSKKVSIAVHYSQFVKEGDFWNEIKGVKTTVQKGENLGEKMCHAFYEAFKKNYQKVVIIGSDCYELKSKHIQLAFKELEGKDVVVGPAEDGGYYLLGMKQLHEEFFKNKNYGTSSVLDELMTEINNLNLSYHHLPTLNDIDTVDDLKVTKIRY